MRSWFMIKSRSRRRRLSHMFWIKIVSCVLNHWTFCSQIWYIGDIMYHCQTDYYRMLVGLGIHEKVSRTKERLNTNTSTSLPQGTWLDGGWGGRELICLTMGQICLLWYSVYSDQFIRHCMENMSKFSVAILQHCIMFCCRVLLN